MPGSSSRLAPLFGHLGAELAVGRERNTDRRDRHAAGRLAALDVLHDSGAGDVDDVDRSRDLKFMRSISFLECIETAQAPSSVMSTACRVGLPGACANCTGATSARSPRTVRLAHSATRSAMQFGVVQRSLVQPLYSNTRAHRARVVPLSRQRLARPASAPFVRPAAIARDRRQHQGATRAPAASECHHPDETLCAESGCHSFDAAWIRANVLSLAPCAPTD